MKQIFSPFLIASVFLWVALTIIAEHKPLGTKHKQLRSAQQLCEEVSHELQLQVEDGMLTAEQAHTVSQRCFQTFTGEPQ